MKLIWDYYCLLILGWQITCEVFSYFTSPAHSRPTVICMWESPIANIIDFLYSPIITWDTLLGALALWGTLSIHYKWGLVRHVSPLPPLTPHGCFYQSTTKVYYLRKKPISTYLFGKVRLLPSLSSLQILVVETHLAQKEKLPFFLSVSFNSFIFNTERNKLFWDTMFAMLRILSAWDMSKEMLVNWGPSPWS